MRKNIAAFSVLGVAGAALAAVGVLVASAQDSPAPTAPRDQLAVVQVTDAPVTTSSIVVTTTKAAPTTSAKVEVKTTEQAAVTTRAKQQQRQAAEGDDPTDEPGGDPSDEPGAPNRNTSSWTPAPVACLPGEDSADCLDDGLHNGSA
jgi:hypothetical protein